MNLPTPNPREDALARLIQCAELVARATTESDLIRARWECLYPAYSAFLTACAEPASAFGELSRAALTLQQHASHPVSQ